MLRTTILVVVVVDVVVLTRDGAATAVCVCHYCRI
jgi:hypothetical protein